MNQLKGNITLFIATIIWGSTFVAQSEGMNYIGPHLYNACRFTVGWLVLIPVAFITLNVDKKKDPARNHKDYIKASIIGGLICGIPEFLASSFQQLGIIGASAAKSGFLTALYIILVPFLSYIVFRRKFPKVVYLSVALAIIGFYFLSIKKGEGFGSLEIYDIYLLLCSLFFTIQILCVDKFAPTCNAVVVSMFQFLVSSILSFILCLISKETISVTSILSCAIPIVYAGAFSCGIAYTLQIVGQKYSDPSIASLIMSLESVNAAIFGFLIQGVALSTRELFGCALIFAGVVISQLPQRKPKN